MGLDFTNSSKGSIKSMPKAHANKTPYAKSTTVTLPRDVTRLTSVNTSFLRFLGYRVNRNGSAIRP